jgi:hypothetical protein
MGHGKSGTTPRQLLIACVCALVALAVVPRWVCGRDADRFFDGDAPAQLALARGVARRVAAQSDRHFYRTGDARFDGQSAIAIYQMTILGLGQVVLEHPRARAELLPAMQSAADRLVDPETLAYAASVWGRHGIAGMGAGEGHAYLGYINLALGVLRAVEPENRHAQLHDRLSAELGKRLRASRTGLIETYPGESWPPDVAAVAGSVGLHARVTGGDPHALDEWGERFARCSIDRSGYLVQRVKSPSCTPADAPRGSGTAVAAYFLSFSHPALARRLGEALKSEGHRTLLGFGGLREYARDHRGPGDVNAGPILMGVSVGASGFGLGAARATGARELYRELYRSAHLFGLPVDLGDTRSYAIGGALGNALLLAMLTARPV